MQASKLSAKDRRETAESLNLTLKSPNEMKRFLDEPTFTRFYELLCCCKRSYDLKNKINNEYCSWGLPVDKVFPLLVLQCQLNHREHYALFRMVFPTDVPSLRLKLKCREEPLPKHAVKALTKIHTLLAGMNEFSLEFQEPPARVQIVFEDSEDDTTLHQARKCKVFCKTMCKTLPYTSQSGGVRTCVGLCVRKSLKIDL